MGQAAGQQAGQPGGGGNADAFKNFRDNNGTFHESSGGVHSNSMQNNNSPAPSNNYNIRNNQMQPHMISPGAMVTQAVSAMASSCSHIDATMPNARMGWQPTTGDSRRFESQNGGDSFATHNMNNHINAAPVAPPPPTKADASTMMSTAFVQRNCPSVESHKEDGGVVEFKIDTMNEECKVSEKYKDRSDDRKPREPTRQTKRPDDHQHDDRRPDEDHHRTDEHNRRNDRREDSKAPLSAREANRHDDHQHDDRRNDNHRTDEHQRRDERGDDSKSDREANRHKDQRHDDDRKHDSHNRTDEHNRHDDNHRRDHRRRDDHSHDAPQQRNGRDTAKVPPVIGMSTYDQPQGPFGSKVCDDVQKQGSPVNDQPQGPFGTVTCDEPIQAPLLFQQSPQKAGLQVAGLESQHSAFTALTSVSQQHACPSMAPSNVGSCVPEARTLNVGEELKMRESWAVGAVIEVFSSSGAKWYIAQVVQLGEKATAHMITVQFVGDNGQILQKSMPRSDVQLAVFGKNTRVMPPNFQKVASASRPGTFAYQDSASGQKYQTKEFAWQKYYEGILKSEQAQQLLKQSQLQPQPQPQPQASPQAVAALEKLKPTPIFSPVVAAEPQPAPTMCLAPVAAAAPLKRVESFGSDITCLPQRSLAAKPHIAAASAVGSKAMPEAHTVQNVAELQFGAPVHRAASSAVANTVSDLRSLPVAASATPEKPQTTGGLPRSGAPFPGYGQSFAVGNNAGYESYLASQGLS